MSREDMMGKISASLDRSVSSPATGTMQLALEKALVSYLLTLVLPNAPPSSQNREDVKYRKNGRIGKIGRRLLDQLTEVDLSSASVVVCSAVVQSMKAVKDIRIEEFKPSDAPSNAAYNSVYGDDSLSNR